MDMLRENPLAFIANPKSVAFWGASNNPLAMGSVQLSSLIGMGFEGPIYPIHPKEETVLGLKAYSSILQVNNPVDLAVLVTPTGVVPEILEECGRAGVKSAVIVSAGFAEMGEDRRAAQNRLVEIAHRYNMPFLGPNCIGVVNPLAKLNTTFFSYDAKPGFVGMASQSGSFVTQMSPYMDQFGLGFSQAFSVGNEAVIDLTDCLEHLADCPHTKVIALYVETIRRGARFVETAKRVSRRKPIVAFYVGGSGAGRKAALSHTGAMAGPDALYEGVFRQAGIVRVQSLEELYDACLVLGSQPLPKGNRIAILTHSGGPGAVAADSAERWGLRTADFTPKTIEALQALAPRTARLGNPVDLTFSRNPMDYVETFPRIVLGDEGVDILFIYLFLTERRVRKSVEALTGDPAKADTMTQRFIADYAASLMGIARDSGKPVAAGTFNPLWEPLYKTLQEGGFPVAPTPERAVKALSALVRYANAKKALDQEGSSSRHGDGPSGD
jgi:acetate---CoA ligase (ADP-forming) subunit alpha